MPLSVVIRGRRPRQRRWFRWLALAFLAAVALVISLPFWAPDFFRDDLESIISSRIDRPARIGDLDVQLVPRPALVAQDVQIGRPEFNARADQVTLDIVLSALTRRVADIPSIRIDGLVWTVPEKPGDLAREINELEFRTSGKGIWKGIVRRVYADDARIVCAGGEESVLQGHVEARDLLEKTITLNVDAAVPVAGQSAKLEGQATFKRQPDAEPTLGVKGAAQLTNVDSSAFVNQDIVPNTRLNFETIDFERTGPDTVTINMAGHSSAGSAEAAKVEALAGTFSAIATWQDGETGIRIDEWRAPGFEFTGDIGVDKEGAVALAIAAGSANAAGVEAYFKLRPLAEYTVTPKAEAEVRVANLRLNRSPDGVLELIGGSASFSGIDLVVEDGAQAFTGFGGEVSIADNTITLDRVAGEGLTIAGTIAPDFAAETYRFNLNGEGVLTPERLRGFTEADWLQDISGRIQIAKVQGTIQPEGGVPDDLVIEGKLAEGRVRIESADWTDSLEQIALTFAAADQRIKTAGSAQSEMFGAVDVDGVFSTEEDRWTGTVSGDLAGVQLPSLEGTTQEVAAAILSEFGRSDLEIAVDMPSDEAERLALDVTRRGDGPAIAAQLALDRIEDAWSLGDVTVTANVPSRVAAPTVPESIVPEGPMAVAFHRSAAEKRFRADINLADATVSMGDSLSKRAGSPFSLSIEGRADEETWAAEVIDIALLDTSVRGVLEGERFRIASLDVDLASFAPLLREGGTASGRITGSVQSNPTDVNLQLNRVRVALNEDLVAENMDGRIRVTDAGIETDALQVNAANSEFTLNLREENNRWTGGVQGTQVDANALTRFAEEYRALMGDDTASYEPVVAARAESGQSLFETETNEPAAETGQSLLSETPAEPAAESSETPDESAGYATPIRDQAKETLEGEFNIDIESLLYRRATLSNVQMDLVASGGNFSAKNLSFVPGTGTASGNVRYTRGEPPHGNRIVTDLVFKNMDAKVLDDLVFEEPRNLRGSLSGDAMLTLPIGDNGVDLRGLGGSVQVTGTDGSLGSLGFANAILFVFKTTEILFLRTPFGEGGLSFDELEGKATIESGVITLGVYEDGLYQEAITLQRPSYRMSAIGWVDLAGDECEVFVHMKPLATVTDAARIFKVDEVEAINSKGGIRIRMTGSPTDPKAQIALGGPVTAITDEIRGGFRSVQGLVVDELLKGLGGLIRDVLNPN